MLCQKTEYGNLHDELLRDGLVVCLKDSWLDRRRDSKDRIAILTLSESKATVYVMFFREESRTKQLINIGRHKRQKYVWSTTENKPCGILGKTTSHPSSQCPASLVICHNCRKRGRYERVCRLAKTVNEAAEDVDELFFGPVTSGEDPLVG